jgi:hypothetical protein
MKKTLLMVAFLLMVFGATNPADEKKFFSIPTNRAD